MSRRPPGPRDSLLGLRLGGRFRRNPLKFLTKLARDYGDLVMFRLGPYRACLVNHPDLVRDVLVTHRSSLPKLESYCRTMRAFSGDTLFVSDGEDWLRQRRMVQPAFHTRRFDAYADGTVRHAQRLIDGWRAGDEFDLTPVMWRLSVLCLGQALFSADLSDQMGLYSRALRIHFETLRDEFRQAVPLPDWLPTKAKRRKRWGARCLRGLIERVIRQRRAAGGNHDDALSMLLSAADEPKEKGGITQEEALHQATLLLVAGQEDVAAALGWCWYVLGRYAAVEARFREELEIVLAGRPPVYADVARLPYLQMVIKETLRMYPTTWLFVPRRATQEIDLGGYRIPRGTWVFVCPYTLHHDPRFFPDPERFDPERFSPEAKSPPQHFAYIPFGGGPRMCIGNHLTFTLLTVVLATVAQRFRLALCDDPAKIVLDPSLILCPRDGLRVRLHAAGGADVPAACTTSRAAA